ncbi:MAG TPA: FAD-dependent monooxygenase, partial [Novosphingobium sp.]|nr:FAD-dependent monooxygenase [Novosphingobium sp.]
HDILTEAAQASGASIRLGTTAHSLVDRGDCVEATFSDGTSAAYDLVLGYDGAFSTTRTQLLGEAAVPAFTGQGVWRYNFPRPASVDTGMVFFGPDTKVGLVPLADDLMYMFVVSAEKDNRWYDGPALADEMRARLAAYGGLVGQLRDQITDPAGVVYRPMINLLVDRPWHRGRILLLGDAAHVTTPHLAQGAAMAVEDAVLIAELLGQDRDLDSILAEFMDRRFDRVKLVVDASTQIAAWEMAEWDGHPAPDADPGGLLHRATAALMNRY